MLALFSKATADPVLDRFIASQKYAEATAYADSALPASSRTTAIWVQLGRANQELGILDRALACYLVGSRIDQKSGDALCGIAAVYNRMGKHSRALTFADKALAVQITSAAEREYAVACIAQGKYDLAQGALQKAVELEPGNVSLLRMLAGLYWQHGAADKALPLTRAAFAAAPNADEACLIGKTMLDSGKPDSAILFLKDALQRNPALFDANLELARAYFRKEKFLAAAVEYEKILDKGTMTAQDYYDRAVAMERNGDSTSAPTAYKAAAKAYGRSKSMESLLSHLKAGAGEIAQKHFSVAISDLTLVAAQDTGHALAPGIDTLLSEAYAGSGSPSRAIECLERWQTHFTATPSTLAKLANLYQRTHARDKANKIYLEIASSGKADPSLLASVGDSNLKAKNYEVALSFYEKSFAVSGSAAAACGMAKCAAALGDWNRAIDAANRAVLKEPKLTEPREIAVNACLRTDRYKEAREHLDALVAQEPSRPELWKQLAFCCKKLGDSAALFAADARVVDLDKSDIESRIRLGATLLARKDFDKALRVYRTLSSLTPHDAAVYKAMYESAVGLSDYLKAATYLKKYCEVAPRDAVARKRLGDLYYDMKSFDAALGAYRTVLELEPGQTGIYKRVAELALSHGSREEAITALTNAVRTGEADPAACGLLGRLLEKKGAFGQALPFLAMAARADTGRGAAFMSLARCQIRAGKTAEAFESLRAAIRSSSDSAEAYRAMGDLYFGRKTPDSAYFAYRTYLRRSPHDTAVAMRAAGLAVEAKDWAAAKEMLSENSNAMAGRAGFELLYGKTLYGLQDCREAAKHLSQALESPKNKDRSAATMRMLADAYDKSNDTAKAVAAYKMYVTFAGFRDPEAAYRLAQLSESADPALSGRMYEKNARRFPNDYRNYFNAARQYSRQSATYDKAVAMIKKCISMRDSVPYLWLVLGRIYDKRGETAPKLKSYRNYLVGEATNAVASEEIGISLLDSSLAKDATVYLENACSLAPADPDYMYQLARCYEKTCRLDEALSLAEKADSTKPGDVKMENFANYMKIRVKNADGGAVQ